MYRFLILLCIGIISDFSTIAQVCGTQENPDIVSYGHLKFNKETKTMYDGNYKVWQFLSNCNAENYEVTILDQYHALIALNIDSDHPDGIYYDSKLKKFYPRYDNNLYSAHFVRKNERRFNNSSFMTFVLQEKQTGDFGVVDRNGDELVTISYSRISPSSCGRRVMEGAGLVMLANEDGSEVLRIHGNVGYPLFGNCVLENGGKYGAIDVLGKTIINPMYEDAIMLWDHMAVKQIGGSWDIINMDGITIEEIGVISDYHFDYKNRIFTVFDKDRNRQRYKYQRGKMIKLFTE